MKFFIDTANVDEIREANDMGIICGVTTNPSLIAKEGRDFNEVIKEITSIVDGPISGEVKATTVKAEDMIAEGREIAKIHPNMVVKIPMTTEGLKAVKALSAEGIKTNVTLIFTANQALLAARAGATYVSPFLGRLDDISTNGTDLIYDIVEIFDNYPEISTEIICASTRHPMHIIECAKAALANGIPVVLGNDVGCPWITQYDFWRELFYFHKYTGVSNAFALYTATKNAAQLAGLGDVTGAVAPGLCADLIVTKDNPLDDLRALRHVELVMANGRLFDQPKFKTNPIVAQQLDRYLTE